MDLKLKCLDTNGSLSAKSIGIVVNVGCEFRASIYGRGTRIKSPAANCPTANSLNPPTIRQISIYPIAHRLILQNLTKSSEKNKTD